MGTMTISSSPREAGEEASPQACGAAAAAEGVALQGTGGATSSCVGCGLLHAAKVVLLLCPGAGFYRPHSRQETDAALPVLLLPQAALSTCRRAGPNLAAPTPVNSEARSTPLSSDFPGSPTRGGKGVGDDSESPTRRQRRRPPCMTEFCSSPPVMLSDCCTPDKSRAGSMSSCAGDFRRPQCLNLATPSSCASMPRRHSSFCIPGSPCADPVRHELKLLSGSVDAVLFDFDGTLTASPGEVAQRSRKQVELRERAPMLRPRLLALREAGLVLGIISKSSELTICGALQEAGLAELFNGPLLAKAVGFEGKAGFIEELVQSGELRHLGADGQRRILLVDDDLRELELARARGIQVFAAPKHGGLQEDDFEQIFAGIGLRTSTLNVT